VFLLIDPQCDFHPSGSLAIPTAASDASRIRDILSLSPSPFTSLYVTLDSHHLHDIAHPVYWVDSEGNHPPPFTLITAEDVKAGKWRTSVSSDQSWGLLYTSALASQGSFTLCIWPPHCLMGTSGHSVHPLINEGITAWLGNNRGKEVRWVMKGMNRYTEMYSCMRAEVEIPDDPETLFNEGLMEELNAFPLMYVAGQARSHCVNFSVRDILPRFKGTVKVLRDGMSDVEGFEEAGREFLEWVVKEGGVVEECKNVK